MKKSKFHSVGNNLNKQYDGFDPEWKIRSLHKSKSWENIGKNVSTLAKNIYRECGFEDDYCIQDNMRFGTIVFGSLNRVYWNFATGFTIGNSWKGRDGYCTVEFRNKFPEVVKDMEEYF